MKGIVAPRLLHRQWSYTRATTRESLDTPEVFWQLRALPIGGTENRKVVHIEVVSSIHWPA